LSGKYKPGASFAENDVRSRHSDERRKAALEEVERIAANEVPAGMDMAQWALAWCLRHDAVTTVIPGCKTPEQAEANAAAARYASEQHPQAWKNEGESAL